jgi:hypothetical protein
VEAWASEPPTKLLPGRGDIAFNPTQSTPNKSKSSKNRGI